MLDYESGKHIAHTQIGATAYRAHFLLHILAVRLLCTPTDSRLRRKETHSPLTYTGAIVYVAHFLLGEYWVHPQILNYEGRKHTATHIYTGAPTSTTHSYKEAIVRTHKFWITNTGNTQAPTHILVQLSMLYISCREATEHTHNSELRRRETHSHTHIYWCNSLCYTFLPARLLCTPKDAELQRQGIEPLTLISFDLIFCAPIETGKASNSNA